MPKEYLSAVNNLLLIADINFASIPKLRNTSFSSSASSVFSGN